MLNNHDWSILQFNLEWLDYAKSVMLRFIKTHHSIQNDTIVDKDIIRKSPTIKIADSFVSRTGGSMGDHLYYYIWAPAYKNIEYREHYRQAAVEFGINNNATICRITHNSGQEQPLEVVKTQTATYHALTHGLTNPTVHKLSIKNMHDGLRAASEYIHNNSVDVFITSTSYVYAMAETVRRFGKLISNICETADIVLLDRLIEVGKIDNWCDHMRCWDGGATFLTCKHHTYHLLDYLADVREVDGALISTDYFSLCTPFVNYNNGDTCTIGNEWKLCDCGRYYREFKMRGRRSSFVLKNGVASIDIEDILCRSPGFKQLQIYNDHAVLATTCDVDIEPIERLIGMPLRLDTNFIFRRQKIPILVNLSLNHQQNT